MIRTLWCTGCGEPRRQDTTQGWQRIRCQACAGTKFTTCPDNVAGAGTARAEAALRLLLADAPSAEAVRNAAAVRAPRLLYCCACGQPRTIDPSRPMRAGLDGARLTCFRCGSLLFTADVARAYLVPPTVWVTTAYDRQLLARLGIARTPAPVEARP